jgi:Bifunctional DNA primase/polymerase, N-terminal/AAA domain
MASNLTIALKYAAAGMAIFPCGIDKRPLVTNWLASATTNEQIIRRWWQKFPDALIGLPLKPLGLIVIDADRHKDNEDGIATLRRLCAEHGELPPHPWATTANGGEHHYFRQPAEKIGNKKIGPGLETRGAKADNDGGYVIASGSQLSDGRRWWRGDGSPSLLERYQANDIPPAPAWLLNGARAEPRTEALRATKVHTNGSREGAFAHGALDRIAAELASAQPGGRNNKLNAAAFRMGTMIARGWIGRPEVADALTAACQSNGLMKNGANAVQATLASGLGDGEQHPHEDLRDDRPADRNRPGPQSRHEPPPQPDLADRTAALISARASSYEMAAIEWLWEGRFAIGKLGLIAGLPDEGKGQVLSYMAAQVTNGAEWPLGEGRAPPGNVVIFSDEDDANDTLVPRLAAAGANLDRVEIIKMARDNGKDRMFSLVTDLELLRQKIIEVGDVRMVLIDPISAYLGIGKIDSFRGTDVRAVLTPLINLAAELRVAIVAVMHFNKKIDVTNALLRISDSLAFGAVARHVFGVIDDEEHERKLFVRAKNNVAARSKNKTLAYRFGAREVGVDKATGKVIWAPHIVWDPQYVDVTAVEAMQAAADSKSPGARDAAQKFLREMLAAGPVAKQEIEEAAKANCISDATLRRAKDALNIVAKKSDFKAGWTWQLPEQTTAGNVRQRETM